MASRKVTALESLASRLRRQAGDMAKAAHTAQELGFTTVFDANNRTALVLFALAHDVVMVSQQPDNYMFAIAEETFTSVRHNYEDAAHNWKLLGNHHRAAEEESASHLCANVFAEVETITAWDD